jgi:hypothetical protein
MQNQTEPTTREMPKTEWIVGEFLNPKPEDLAHRFSIELTSQSAAKVLSKKHRGTIYAVWDGNFNVESIWIEGLRFNAAD